MTKPLIHARLALRVSIAQLSQMVAKIAQKASYAMEELIDLIPQIIS